MHKIDEYTVWKAALSASRSLTKFLDGLSCEERTSLIEGKSKLTFYLQEQNESSKSTADWDPREVINKLNLFESREDAVKWIDSLRLTKKQYQDALKSIDVPWDKADKADRLLEKLVESTIGFKLRSKAIQGS